MLMKSMWLKKLVSTLQDVLSSQSTEQSIWSLKISKINPHADLIVSDCATVRKQEYESLAIIINATVNYTCKSLFLV